VKCVGAVTITHHQSLQFNPSVRLQIVIHESFLKSK
jgi:hypothetical protein